MTKDIVISSERIISKIYIIRNRKVMLDRDLAVLYGVKTMVLNQAVKRNIKRFPADFMFQLDKEEMKNWISQIVISRSGWGGTRKLSFAFTEQGVVMLSSVLNSDRATEVNIQITIYYLKMFYFKKLSSLILIFLAVFASGFSVLSGLDTVIGFVIIKMFNHTAFLRASGRRQFFYGK